ncbi:MAG: carbohydrate kinase [Candidatus Methylacidiphilales bacterium]
MKPVLCFGEVLWDCLPAGLFLGGAPINVAYHLHRLGTAVLPVTAVGDDFLGGEICRRLDTWKMDVRGIHVAPGLPTGVVIASLDEGGSAAYTIPGDSAWDHIELTQQVQKSAPDAAAIVFGSLALRGENNRWVLEALRGSAPDALIVLDVNFRPPHDDLQLAFTLMRSMSSHRALVKVNHHEAARLSGGGSADYETNARWISHETGVNSVCVTAGAEGAGLWYQEAWHWEKARPVHVVDTVGAGDAFLAALLHGLLREPHRPMEHLAAACRSGERVAGLPGAQC